MFVLFFNQLGVCAINFLLGWVLTYPLGKSGRVPMKYAWFGVFECSMPFVIGSSLLLAYAF